MSADHGTGDADAGDDTTTAPVLREPTPPLRLHLETLKVVGEWLRAISDGPDQTPTEKRASALVAAVIESGQCYAPNIDKLANDPTRCPVEFF